MNSHTPPAAIVCQASAYEVALSPSTLLQQEKTDRARWKERKKREELNRSCPSQMEPPFPQILHGIILTFMFMHRCSCRRRHLGEVRNLVGEGGKVDGSDCEEEEKRMA